MTRPPLSARHNSEATKRYEALHDGIPDWMLSSIQAWLRPFFVNQRNDPHPGYIRNAERYLRLNLNWGSDQNQFAAIQELMALLTDGTAGLDLIDYCLGTCRKQSIRPSKLHLILNDSGSAWTVRTDPDENYCLERRVEATSEAAARAEMAESGKAAAYLQTAWNFIYGRSSNPSAAYKDAIRAVEAAARPILSPNDDLATLGKMIGSTRSVPDKWTTVIGDVETIIKLMETVWKSQHDRHGTDDETKALNVTHDEAEAAVQIAVLLVQLFRSSAIRTADE